MIQELDFTYLPTRPREVARAPKIAGIETHLTYPNKKTVIFPIKLWKDYNLQTCVESVASRIRDLDPTKATMSYNANRKRVDNWRGFSLGRWNLTAHDRAELINTYLEGKLNGEQEAVVKDMLSGEAEWLDTTFANVAGTLEIDTTYGSAKRKNILSVGVSSLTPDVPIPLHDLPKRNSKLVELLWGRPFGQLPEQVQKEAAIIIPPPGYRVVTIGNGHVIGNAEYTRAASRGVYDTRGH